MNLLLLLLLLLLPFSSANTESKSPPGVEPTCKSINRHSIPFAYCTNVLFHAHLNPNSLDLPSLASLVANQAVSHAECTENRMTDLLHLEHDHDTRAKYIACQSAFNDVAETLKDGVDAITHHKYRKARHLINGVVGIDSAFDKCDHVWGPTGLGEGRTALTLADAEYKQLAEMAAAIIDLADPESKK